jgi:hypothetical protein
MHKRQGWKEVTPDGKSREVRATREGRNWRIQSRLKGVKEWTYHDPPLRDDLEHLLAMLQRKYRRRRCSEKEVEDVARLLERCP